MPSRGVVTVEPVRAPLAPALGRGAWRQRIAPLASGCREVTMPCSHSMLILASDAADTLVSTHLDEGRQHG